MIKNKKFWDEEYNHSKLITKNITPQRDFLRFIEWLKKNKHIDFSKQITVLDLGCGIGRNVFYLVERYNVFGYGWDFSETAIKKAREIFSHQNIVFEKRDFSHDFPLEDDSVDIVLDITASNALSERGREKYLSEMFRVMKNNSFLYVRALAKEGDKNAQALIKKFPGAEKDTYIHPELNITERVFSGPDFKETYGKYFETIRMIRKTGYQRFGKQSYKRNYWNAYLIKK